MDGNDIREPMGGVNATPHDDNPGIDKLDPYWADDLTEADLAEYEAMLTELEIRGKVPREYAERHRAAYGFDRFNLDENDARGGGR